MLAGSDLDLMLIYDHAPMATAPVPYFVRLAHAFTAALTAQGPEGPLYKVDMRLRPSGAQGPVAVARAAFRRYHAETSQTLGTPGADPCPRSCRDAGLRRDRHRRHRRRSGPAGAGRDNPRRHRGDARKINAEIKPAGPFDVKYRAGGMIEVAFIAEALQLIHGPADPTLFRANTAAAFGALAEAGHLPPAAAKALIAADRLWRTIQGIDRITGLGEATANPPPAMLAPLLRATGTADLAALTAAMAKAGETVRDCFERYLIKGDDK